ncbi:tetratricopeptide repeat protein [Chitinophaga sp. SYP-B3965]|uniref:tetratricopeptide repeat-containing sensor histidine kinase n=1 Tax=Chitinophaga sp. SYP-B3965 TaxID=2663120 RepID=UPI001299FC28|nr:histidine kinase [Chitinophaga sp. SYP-B3965]MRG48426.1 tetratricopeptide repeat protein [Chitinophaga sp. SYP-B3965]
MLRTASLLLICFLFCLPLRADTNKKEQCWQYIQAGNNYLWSFLPLDAWKQYHSAMDLAVELHDEFLFAESLFGIGQALWYNGKFYAAVDTVKLSIIHYKNKGSKTSQGVALRILSNIYDDQGDYENAFKMVTQALVIFEGGKHHQNYILSLVQMGSLYKSMGDYETAMGYYGRAEAVWPFQDGGYPYRELYHRMGELYAAKGDITQARVCYQKSLSGNIKGKIVRLKMGDTYLKEKKYDIAFRYYDSLYKEAKLLTDINIVIGSMLGLGKIYLVRNDLKNALMMVEGSLEHSAIRGARQNKRDAYELLSAIYEASGDNKKALAYHKQYEALKDSVISETFKRKMFGSRQEAEAGRLKSQRNILIACVAGVLLLGIFALLLTVLRHRNEKLRLKQRAAELEMKALRAQMNPHFIFNCLSSINHFILNEEGDKASEYLTRFSKLIRTVLVNAGKTTITLEEELAMLRLYLNMEQLRFREAFEYTIDFDPGLHPSMIFVPSFILQPFCENAIWHGLLHKEGKGELHIHFSMQRDILTCTIRDNGIGREKAAAFRSGLVEKGASFGNRLSAERLALFNGDQSGASFKTEDIIGERGEIAGTKVILKINNKLAHD